FFFSSRRRHTRFSRDWSSDVCSSDLGDGDGSEPGDGDGEEPGDGDGEAPGDDAGVPDDGGGVGDGGGAEPAAWYKCQTSDQAFRSEERRVGKAGRCGGSRER